MAKRDDWDKRYSAKALNWSVGPNALFAQIVGKLPSGRAIDVASGEGRNAIWLAEQGWEVDAIDFSKIGITKSEQIAVKKNVKVHWIVDDVTSFEFAPGAYDLVAVLYLHTSLAERERWLPRVIDAVAPGGHFVYIAHDPANVESGVGGPQDKSLLPSVVELTSLLDGFLLQRSEVYERDVDCDPGHGESLDGVALDTLIHAVREE